MAGKRKNAQRLAAPRPRRPNAEGGPTVAGTCSKCGAAVSGFPGDFAKCASCRYMQMLAGEPPPGWRLVGDPGRLRATPFYFIFLFYASLVAIYWTGGGRDPQGGTDLFGSAVVVGVFAMWILSIMQFSKAAERQRRWWVPVLEYHVSSLIMVPCFALGFRGCASAVHGDLDAVMLLSILFVAVGLFIGVLLYGDARRRVAHLRIVRDK